MNWIDLTLKLDNSIAAWPNSSQFKIKKQQINCCTISEINLPLHYGTHIDTPLHFIPNGKTVDQLNINELCGICQIIDTQQSQFVNRHHVQNISRSIVFFKTRNKITSIFEPDYCYISPEAAQILVDKGVKIVGIDYLSVENFQDTNFTTHKILLGNNILIIEGLDIKKTEEGEYEVMIVPLILETEASPVRVLIKPFGPL